MNEPFKILITTRYAAYSSGASIHTLMVEFGTKEDAVLAIKLINEANNKESVYTQTAIALF